MASEWRDRTTGTGPLKDTADEFITDVGIAFQNTTTFMIARLMFVWYSKPPHHI
jgi:hypothetical protein